MSLKYIVASPGRSGSVFTTLVIAKSLKLVPLFDSKQLSDVDSPSVLHTHDACLQASENTTVVCVQRKNLFNEVVSAIIAEHYQEWNAYTANGDPFVVDNDMFEVKYIWHKHWHKAFDYHTSYTNKTYINFEDFIGDSQKSMRKPHECILNFDQLTKTFELFENNSEFQNLDTKNYTWVDLKRL